MIKPYLIDFFNPNSWNLRIVTTKLIKSCPISIDDFEIHQKWSKINSFKFKMMKIYQLLINFIIFDWFHNFWLILTIFNWFQLILTYVQSFNLHLSRHFWFLVKNWSKSIEKILKLIEFNQKWMEKDIWLKSSFNWNLTLTSYFKSNQNLYSNSDGLEFQSWQFNSRAQIA